MITKLRTTAEGNLSYERDSMLCLSSLNALLVRHAWDKGMDLEDLADGFGEGQGTCGDWSGVRDSTQGAWDKMLERALNHLGIRG